MPQLPLYGEDPGREEPGRSRPKPGPGKGEAQAGLDPRLDCTPRFNSARNEDAELLSRYAGVGFVDPRGQCARTDSRSPRLRLDPPGDPLGGRYLVPIF